MASMNVVLLQTTASERERERKSGRRARDQVKCDFSTGILNEVFARLRRPSFRWACSPRILKNFAKLVPIEKVFSSRKPDSQINTHAARPELADRSAEATLSTAALLHYRKRDS